MIINVINEMIPHSIIMNGMSTRSRPFNNSINETIEFLTYHYHNFVIEDLLFRTLRDFIKNLVEELQREYFPCCEETINAFACKREVKEYLDVLSKTLYATSNEPVRLGAFRVLLLESYKRLLGDLVFKPSGVVDLALHGILKEESVILTSRNRAMLKSYHFGIDYMLLVEYPIPNRKHKVFVPLFVIAKSSFETIKEIDIIEAIRAKIEEPLERKDGPDNVTVALRSIPKFTRIVLTRVATYNEKIIEKPCVNREYQSIPVYGDLACGIISLVLKDLPDMYKMVISNEELVGITINDWIVALLSLAIPLLQVTVASANRPPDPPGGATVDAVVRKIHQETLEKIGKEIQQQLFVMRNHTLQDIRRSVEKKLNSIIDHYRNYGSTSTMVEMST